MIEVINLCKTYKLYSQPIDRIKEALFGKTYHHQHTALSGISFKVESGETLGVIGKNGAGKSTLLKLLVGVALPDAGRIEIDGKITGLLELGTGFDHELSGSENIAINGLLLGMEPKQIEDAQASIIAFSELGEYIKEPLRTYSSGMVMRLAFSIAIHAAPQCFVIDEALSVGDAHFQQKCIKKIQSFKQEGGSIIFVSHDLNAVKMICDRVIVLEKGNIVINGTPEQAVNVYNSIIAQLDEEDQLTHRSSQSHFGNRKANLVAANFYGCVSNATVITSGEAAIIELVITSKENIEDLTIGIMIRDRFGQDIYGVNSHYLKQTIAIKAGQKKTARFTIKMDLSPGKYTIAAALHSGSNHLDDCYFWADNILSYEIAGIQDYIFAGLCKLPTELLVE